MRGQGVDPTCPLELKIVGISQRSDDTLPKPVFNGFPGVSRCFNTRPKDK